MSPQTVQEIAPEVLVVGQPEPSATLVAQIRGQGYAAAICEPEAVVQRLGAQAMPGAVVVCTAGLDVAEVMQQVRQTPLGAAIVITLYGELGDPIRDLADVLDLGADHFLRAPASDVELRLELEALTGPASSGPESDGLSREYGSWPNRTEVIDGPGEAPGPAAPLPTGADGVPMALPGVAAPASASEAEQVLGQLHRTLDMLEQRLKASGDDGGRAGDQERGEAEREHADLSEYGLDAVPGIEGGARNFGAEQDAAHLGLAEFELPLASLTSPGAIAPRHPESPESPESTVRLGEETSEVAMPMQDALDTAARVAPDGEHDRPQPSGPTAVERQGSLDVVEVPRLLWTLHRARFRGRLTLQHGKIEKSVWFDAGNPVFARSNVEHDRLADALLRRGVLSRSQYETACRVAHREPRRAGQQLVEAGLLKPSELHRVVRMHLARIIDSTFPWRTGRWQVVPGEACDEAILLHDAPAQLLADGVRNRMQAHQLVGLLGGLDIVPRLDPHQASEGSIEQISQSLRVTPSEEVWIGRLDGRHSLGELTALAGADELELFGLVYLLHITGYVALSAEPEPEPLPDLRPEDLDAQRIEDRLRTSRQLDYFEVLGLDRDACRVDVHRAYVDVSITFADDSLEPSVREAMADQLAELRGALAEARDVLMDDGLRSAYLAHLEEP